MKRTDASSDTCVCTRCGAVVECCSFCEREDCDSTICYRCLRLELGQRVTRPRLTAG